MDAHTSPRSRPAPVAALTAALAGLTPLERLVFALYGLLLLSVCLYSLLWPATHTVYPIYALAADHWLAGQDMYGSHPTWDRFRYSPAVAVAMLPFRALPPGWGGAAWRLACAAVLLAGMAAWFRYLLAATGAGEPSGTRRRWFALLLLLVLPLTVTNLRNAQANPMVLGFALLAVTAAAHRRWGLSGLAAAAAALLKIYPIALGLLLALIYPRRFALRLAAALTAGLAAPFLFQDPQYVAGQYASWVHQNTTDGRQADRGQNSYRNVLLLAPGGGAGVSARDYQVLQLAVAGVIAAACLAARLRRWPPHRLLPLLIGLACCWMTGFGPASEGPTYILLAATASWAVVDAFRRPASVVGRAIAVAAYALLMAGFVSAGSPAVRGWTALAHPAAAVLLLVHGLAGAVIARVREPAEPSAPPDLVTPAEGDTARAA